MLVRSKAPDLSYSACSRRIRITKQPSSRYSQASAGRRTLHSVRSNHCATGCEQEIRVASADPFEMVK